MNNEGYQITYTGEEVQELLDKAGTAVQTETDPTVPSWAKAEEKPTYTATEVGALPDDTELFSGSYNDLTDKPTIPDSLSDLSDDSTHRLVTDAEKTEWNGKSDFSGSYDDLTDKPTIPDAQVQSDWTEADSTKVDYIKNKPSLATVATSGSYNDLSNTPTIPTVPAISTDISADGTSDAKTASPKAVKTFVEGKGYITSAHEVPSGGNAGQVLSKNSATDYDVHWVNQTITYPSAYSTTAGGTAAKKASCSLYALQTNSYVHVLMGGSNTYAGALTLSINSTTAKPIYINGAASSSTNYTLPSGTYIVFYDGTNYYFRTDGKIQGLNGTLVCTSSTSGLIKNDGTIDTNTYLTQHQDISGKADKSEMSVSASGDQTTITLKSGTSATVINQHQSLSGYVQTSNTAGLIKNDGTIDTTSYGTYSKPSGGIPAADLASGVIPTVPTISTDISTDGSSDTKTASPKAVKTFVEGKGYTTNTGTITSIKMNGSTIASSGEANLGTVITDISGKQDVIDSSHKLSADLISDGTTNKAYTATEQSKLSGIAAGAEVNVQANWNESDSSSDAYIQNKPTIPTVPSNIVTGSSQSYTIWSGTQAEYDALATKDSSTIYLIKES